MRPWVDSVFRGRRPKFEIWASEHGLASGEEIRVLHRLGFDGRSAVIVGVTETNCYIRPDQSLPTGAGTDIELAAVDSVKLTGGVVANVIIDTGRNYYRLPSTIRPRARRIAAEIADGAGLRREGIGGMSTQRGWHRLLDRPVPLGTGLAGLGALVGAIGLLTGGPAGAVPGVLLLVLGGLVATLGSWTGTLDIAGWGRTDVWQRSAD